MGATQIIDLATALPRAEEQATPMALGLDVGLAHVGYALVALEPDRERVLDVRTIHTEKCASKLGVLVAHDDVRRIRVILDALHAAVMAASQPGLGGVRVICAELPHGSKGARAAAALGMGKAIVSAVAWRYDLPLAACNPQQLKKVLTGSSSASKADVQVALCGRYGPDVANAFVRETGKYRGKKMAQWCGALWGFEECEHIGDALGAVVTCLDSDVVRAVRRVAA